MGLWLEILIWILLSVLPLWLLWKLGVFAARGFAKFADPAVGRAVKLISLVAHGLGLLLLAIGILSGIPWDRGRLQLLLPGIGFVLGGIWLMSTRGRKIERYLAIAGVVQYALGMALMGFGLMHAILWPQPPVVGTASPAELISLGGAALAGSALFGIAPGGPAGPPAG